MDKWVEFFMVAGLGFTATTLVLMSMRIDRLSDAVRLMAEAQNSLIKAVEKLADAMTTVEKAFNERDT